MARPRVFRRVKMKPIVGIARPSPQKLAPFPPKAGILQRLHPAKMSCHRRHPRPLPASPRENELSPVPARRQPPRHREMRVAPSPVPVALSQQPAPSREAPLAASPRPRRPVTASRHPNPEAPLAPFPRRTRPVPPSPRRPVTASRHPVPNHHSPRRRVAVSPRRNQSPRHYQPAPQLRTRLRSCPPPSSLLYLIRFYAICGKRVVVFKST